ncbi:MAG: amidohydrolase family protein [Gammaproteobacteria bacterium]|nr:amidohydrolase family protein [Gammaproteobacteria bacterium]
MKPQSLAALCLLLPALALAQMPPAKPPAPDRYTLVQAGSLLAVPGKAPQERVTVIIRNERIAAIESGFATTVAGAPPDATVTVIDLRDRFVLPGLMDAHVHLQGEPSFSRRRVERGDRNPPTGAEGAVNAMIHARRTLNAGFTTVRDVGSNDESVFAARNAINAGRMIGPRILVSGPAISGTAGHADNLPFDEDGDPQARISHGICDGPVACRGVVRYNYKLGADVIKMTPTAGFSDNTGTEPQMFEDEMQAVITTAHMLGLKVAAHAYSPIAIRQAVNAGVDSIEHGFLLDDEGIRMMKAKGTFLVPTLSASYPPPVFRIPDPESVRLRNQYKAFERAYAAGVKIAFGTDAGTFSHGDNAKEFGYMVQFGMQPMDAIRAATVVTADLFGISAEAGTIEPGKLADLIAVQGSPLEDIARLRHVDFIMKSGRVAKQGGQMTEPFSYPAAFLQ